MYKYNNNHIEIVYGMDCILVRRYNKTAAVLFGNRRGFIGLGILPDRCRVYQVSGNSAPSPSGAEPPDCELPAIPE